MYYTGCVSIHDHKRDHLRHYGLVYIIAGMLCLWAVFVFR